LLGGNDNTNESRKDFTKQMLQLRDARESKPDLLLDAVVEQNLLRTALSVPPTLALFGLVYLKKKGTYGNSNTTHIPSDPLNTLSLSASCNSQSAENLDCFSRNVFEHEGSICLQKRRRAA
jgi:hypothetical protein